MKTGRRLARSAIVALLLMAVAASAPPGQAPTGVCSNPLTCVPGGFYTADGVRFTATASFEDDSVHTTSHHDSDRGYARPGDRGDVTFGFQPANETVKGLVNVTIHLAENVTDIEWLGPVDAEFVYDTEKGLVEKDFPLRVKDDAERGTISIPFTVIAAGDSVTGDVEFEVGPKEDAPTPVLSDETGRLVIVFLTGLLAGAGGVIVRVGWDNVKKGK